MIEEPATWGQAGIGTIVKDPRAGTYWHVDVCQDGHIAMRDPAGRISTFNTTFHAADPITVLSPTWPEALATMSAVLGASVIPN